MTSYPAPSPTDLSPEAIALLEKARMSRIAIDDAARDTATAADELRRYARFSRPGQPSAHIVQLRQRQARARIKSSQAKQAFLQAAREFVHTAGLLPANMSLESFVLECIERAAQGPSR
ncbi:hypothetical protein [Luteibacter yeojuensis]|uniref:Uncharacterized protein n=1 Tax=Luteibacter yeojuensis TaxID=345309 RepID=A0A7X5QRM8_9GAMM|nr:hypothetical protein [Luteibacter yeojuensis]NID14109.1 hypothetical protein [Luteibacter yeojuensis]